MKRLRFPALTAIILIRLLAFTHVAEIAAQSPVAPPTPSPSQAHSLSELQLSLEKSLLAEQEAQEQLQAQLKRVNQQEESFNNELNAQRIQISSYNNLLLISNIAVNDLLAAQENLLSGIGHISVQLKTLEQELNALEKLRLDAQKQYLLNEKQISEIQHEIEENSSEDQSTEALLGELRQLTLLLSMKQEIIETIHSQYEQQVHELEQVHQDFEELAGNFEARIAERKKQALFTRQESPLGEFGKDRFLEEFEYSLQQIRQIVNPSFWTETLRTLWEAEGILLLRFVAFMMLVFFLLLRLRRFFSQTLKELDGEREPWHSLIIQLLHQSLLLSGVALTLYLYVTSRPLYSPPPLKSLILPILLIVLFTRWLLAALRFWEDKSHDSPFLHLVSHERLFFRGIRYFVILYIVFSWAFGANSVMLALGRGAFELGLFFWNILFLREFRKIPEQHFPGSLRTGRNTRTLIIALGHVIASGGLLIALAGYGSLAQHWYVSWWHSCIVLFWSGLIFNRLREWEGTARSDTLFDGDHNEERAAHQVSWLFARLSWIAWPLFSLIGVLIAWGEMQVVLSVTLEILTFPLSIGGITISLVGVIYSLLILLITHVLTRLWKRLLTEKILVNSALDQGMQVSISTISTYLIWLFGILWALNALGIGATSIAVAFGALGIGIGFGLQSIFNNFLSGVILLFERPIEVGDVLEVSGNWGFVEKINVRSTVIRTYDNSALIIPNSDIISNQLTNWTFKDVRVRRTITVGVAYGSDTRLVEQSLYEIAEKHARVMTDPAPIVLFSDFGAHSLTFKLRVWTLLDYGLSTETDIRFEIDKVFRERQIEIAFPQLDVHLDYVAPAEKKEESNEEL